MAQFLNILILLSNLTLQMTFGANILFLFGGGNYSHKKSIWPLVMELSNKGHNVTFVSSVSKQPKPNEKVADLVPGFMKSHMEDMFHVDRIQNRKEGKEIVFSPYESSSLHFCNLTMNSQDDHQFTNLIENERFDLIVVNSVFGEGATYLAHHLGSKFVLFDSGSVVPWNFGTFGLPLETSWIPDYVSWTDYPMGFWGRVKALYHSWAWYRFSAGFEEGLKKIYRKRFGLRHPPELVAVQRNASLVLVNSHYSVDFARSLPPMFVNIGGMECWEPEGDLPGEMKRFMDSAEEGVILISFGSTIEFNTLPEKYLSIFFNMMRKFSKIGFIWRWDGPLPDDHPKNLFATKWLPQREILHEKSVRALMTHGGKNSMLEATYYGVPVVAMPLFADQDAQAYRIQAQKIGVYVEAAELTQGMLDEAISEILHNSIYKKNMVIRSKLFRDRPNPTETAVSALEFVLRHDDLTPLKPMELQQSFWVRQHLDVYLVFLLFFVMLFLVPYFLIKICRNPF